MEKDINKQKQKFFIMKNLIFSLIFLLSIFSVNSAVTYNIDEGFGGVIFDSANVGQSGIVFNKPKNVLWIKNSLHGLYSVGFIAGKGDLFQINDYPKLTPQLGNFTIEVEYLPTTQLGITETVFDKLGSYTFSITPTAQPIFPAIKIPDGTLTLNIGGLPIIIPISNISFGKMNTLIITKNDTHYTIYNDGIAQGLPILNALPISLSPLSPLILFDDNAQTGFNVGCQGIMPIGSICSFSGLIDEFNIFNSYVNQSLVNNLLIPTTILNNGVTTIKNTILIKNITSPVLNQSFIENAEFNIKLTEVGTCNLYIDNNFKQTFNNILVSNTKINFNKNYGNHSFFYNCFNSNFNEITEPLNFSVSKTPNTQITFTFSGTNFNINSIPLELVSPCLKQGLTFGGAIDGYKPRANPGGATFKDIVNGQATMTLNSGTNEFCLIHGLISYDTYNKTNNFNVNNLVTQIKLGNYDMPNNLSTSYAISLDNFDMFKKTNPKAWGTTWVLLISSILAFGLGLLILIGGMATRSGQAVMIGGLLLLFSLGYQVSNLIFGVLI